jgi:GNAT superfamily N-acetyltransferase
VIDPLVILKRPRDCSDQELEGYAALVLRGDEVIKQGLGERIRQAAVLTFAFQESRLVGVAALKTPADGYRTGVFRKAGAAERSKAGDLELGWVFVLADYRGRGVARRVVTNTLDAADGAGVFATTRSENDAMRTLLEAQQLVRAGQPYRSTRGDYELILFSRSASAPSAARN